MPEPGAPPIWMDLSIDRVGDELRVRARGSRGEETSSRPLGAGRGAAAMLDFGASVREAAARRKPLGAAPLAEAQAVHEALREGDVGVLHDRLCEAAGGPLLVRLMIHRELQGVPWEALCKPGEALGFWGSSADRLVVRGVTTTKPWEPPEVKGAVRVLAIAPTGESSLWALKDALADRIAKGEVEWLDPLVGPAARNPWLFDRLRRDPIPHVLHFVGHGGVDEKGLPVLRLADDEDGEETCLPVELLAQQVEASCRGCSGWWCSRPARGARPGSSRRPQRCWRRRGSARSWRTSGR
jgi:hypothetical protein